MWCLYALNTSIIIFIGGTFDGSMANDYEFQVNLIKSLAKQCHLRSPEFKNIKEICDARVPILKLYHVPTRFNCDISFKSGLSVRNSKLIKYVLYKIMGILKCRIFPFIVLAKQFYFLLSFRRSYLSMSNTVKWFVCFVVKLWAPQNELISRNLFTSYALVWLALFYLMSEKIVPPLSKLVKCATPNDHKIIEGTLYLCKINAYKSEFFKATQISDLNELKLI